MEFHSIPLNLAGWHGIRGPGRSIGDREVLKLTHIIFQIRMNFCHPRFRWATMAPLDDLIHSFLIAFKNRLDTAIPAVSNPAFYSQFKSHLLSVVAEENSLDSSFNDDVCPHLFHIDLAGMCPAGPPLRWGRGTQYKWRLPHRWAPPSRAGSFTFITGFV